MAKPATKTTNTADRETLSINFSVGREFKVNKSAGQLNNLALITANREATGHGIYIDEKTLETGLASVSEKGGKLKAYTAHPTFKQWYNEESRLMDIPGFFSGVHRDGDKLTASNFEFFESFKQDETTAFNRLMELAEKTPELFGLSIEARGYGVYVDSDGNEYSQAPEDVELLYEGMPAFRIVELKAAAFTEEPAANSSLYASIKAAFGGREKSLTDDDIKLLATAFESWTSSNINPTKVTRAAPNKDTSLKKSPENQKPKPMDELIKALMAKFTDEAQYREAVFVATKNFKEGMTADDVAAILKQQADAAELEALRAKAEKADQLEEENKTLKTEKADVETKFNNLKESGHTGGEVETFSQSDNTTNRDGSVNLTALCLEKNGIATDDVKFTTTDIDDLYRPDIWIPHAEEMVPKFYSMFMSNVFVSPNSIQKAAQGGGSGINVPLLHEPDFADAVQTASAPTINNVDSDQGWAPFFNRVRALGANALAQTQSGLDTDLVRFILQSTKGLRWRQRQTVLLAMLRAYFGTSGSGALADLRNDFFDEDGASPASTDLFDSDMFNFGVANLGEIADRLEGGILWIHPDVHAAINNADDITTEKTSDGRFQVKKYKGVLTIIQDKNLVRDGSTSGKVYDTYVLGPGSIAMADRTQSSRVGDQASILVDEDKATNEMAVYDRDRYILAPNGSKFVGTVASEKSGATNAEISDEADWSEVLDHIENAGMLQFRTNG